MALVRRALFSRPTSQLIGLTSHRTRCLLNFRNFSRRSDDEWVDDFNKEMENVFGRPPESPSQWGGHVASENLKAGFSTNHYSPDEEDSRGLKVTEGVGILTVEPRHLTHVDGSGKASMVNVAEKAETKRVAVASGRVFLGPKAFELVAENNIAKGDVLTVAKIAGIQGAKQTSNLIPLCHNILLSGVDVSTSLNEELHAVDIRAEATATGPTGVEMEALTAVSVASLTVYDMCKAVSKDIQISNVQLESKTGGKSGDWYRE
ncbi:hypothetical protein R1sor_005938 [Riccia sorocarpa]|uniref:cyclic pyranopterin monophosphate synthase n=1 Tax=Riccia sorocarpa TaxID=122646 RepID=A0ABD3HNY1_9MARC